jgi:hypothetical protein
VTWRNASCPVYPLEQNLADLFVAGQYLAWLQLSGQGVFLASNPSSSFFYVLTAAHALHVLGGLVGIVFVIHNSARQFCGGARTLLAFYGCPLGVPDVAALDEALTHQTI